MKSKTINITKWKLTTMIVFFCFSFLALLLILYFYSYQNKIYPGIYINNVSVGGFTKEDAITKLQNHFVVNESLTIVYNERKHEIPLSDLSFSYSIPQTVLSAYTIYRDKPIINTVVPRIAAPFKNETLPLTFSINEELLTQHIMVFADEIYTEHKVPTMEIENGELIITKGEQGKTIPIDSLKETIKTRLALNDFSPVEVPLETTGVMLSDTETQDLLEQSEVYQDKTLLLTHKETTYELSGIDLIRQGTNFYDLINIPFNDQWNHLKEEIETAPQNPVFKLENDRVVEFLPAVSGITIDFNKFEEELKKSLIQVAQTDDPQTLAIPVIEKAADFETKDINNLGIKELVGYGSSQFKGSIASRVHNIGLGASKFNGVLIAPGEVFSFNKTVGDVSTYTGYKQSYIIQDGKTILGDGGGLCQVSTTLFRAALDAGLPIEERRSHSYRVTYYEQDSGPGLDATVYSPTTDFKFINDTDNHLLIQTLFNAQNATLEFEIYGTKDGREVELTKPIITSQSPPPEDFYQDDPTLPQGVVKQIDWKAWGAKVQFDYKVTKNGEVLFEERFYSNYRPWQAKFLRGTAPIN